MNVITILHQAILVIILPRYLIFIMITIVEVPPIVTFFLREGTLCSMVNTLFVSMEQKNWNNVPLNIRNSPSVGKLQEKDQTVASGIL